MKHVLILCDGMSDNKIKSLGDKTPMTVANKPNMDKLAKNGYVGLVKTVADNLKPGSDVANLSVLGYDPAVYYSGRSPLEAASIGINLKSTDVTLRCNLVTLSDDEPYENKTMLDYCADDISTKEANELIKAINQELGDKYFKFFTGTNYRHCLVWENGTTDLGDITPPHDITDRKITQYLPTSKNAEKLLFMMKKSYDILKNHPVNVARVSRGLKPANSIWLWGEGKKKPLTPFEEKYGLKGSMISAVDLLKGIAKLASMNVVEVPGATGYIDTNFEGKMSHALKELENGQDFVYIHIEAPDECSHRGEIDNKIKSIEIIDKKVLAPVVSALEKYEDYKIMILPDHATPVEIKTHTSDPVPFLIYRKQGSFKSGVNLFNEQNAMSTGEYIQHGPSLMEKFINY